MVVAEITSVGWLISTPKTADPLFWFLAAVSAVSLGLGVFLAHRQNAHSRPQPGCPFPAAGTRCYMPITPGPITAIGDIARATPCGEYTCFARSIPTVVTCAMTPPLR